jgi:hypothetical protein
MEKVVIPLSSGLAHNRISCPVFVNLKPEDTHHTGSGTHDKINKWNCAKPEEILKSREVKDKEQAADCSCKDPPECPVLGTQRCDKGL